MPFPPAPIAAPPPAPAVAAAPAPAPAAPPPAPQPIAEPVVVAAAPAAQPVAAPAPAPADPSDTSAFDWQTILPVLQQAFELYKKHWQTFLITVAVLLVPVSLLKSFVLSALAPSPPKVENIEDAFRALAAVRQSWASAMFGSLVAGLLTYAAFMLIQAALTAVVSDRMLGGRMGPADAWKTVIGRGNKLFSALLPAIGIIVAGTLLFLVPGLVASFLLIFTVPVALFEPQRGMEALKRSYKLVLSDWLRVLIVLLVFMVLSWIAGFIGAVVTPKYAVFWSTLIGDLITAAILPFPIIGAVILYLERRKAVDGLSDDQMREQMQSAIQTR